MNLTDKDILKRLGAGESIATVCEAAGISRAEFDGWWKRQTRLRVPDASGRRKVGVRKRVRIERDRRGVPHIFADNDADLFFGLGYAMAQDRLFQLDFLRRRGAGRLAEVLGPDGAEMDVLARTTGLRSILELDILARTVGLRRIAEAEWSRLPKETQAVVEAFTAGVNALMEECRSRLPIEFDLLDYQPEPWSPIDCLTIESEFRWYLTGRFPVIVMPELARRTLGDGALYRAFLQRECDEESILPPGSYPARRCGSQPVGTSAGAPNPGEGSNNWVVSGKRTQTGKPMVASDPHIAFEAVSCWYQVHLCGGAYNVAGMAYVGMPAVMFGRTPHVAWGCTNNICSQRDLYLERTAPEHPGCFLYDGKWVPARELQEVIPIRGREPLRLTVRFSHNGPIVSDILPPPARTGEPVALKWLGAYQGGWLTALLAMDRARSAKEFREALRPWYVPTFCVVFADTAGHIGYHATGRLPIRKVLERGYRPGWDPEHQWDGLIPFEGMPQLADPQRGWIATANNRVAPDDFPYPLSGTWPDGLRFARIRQMLEAQETFTREDFGRMQLDALSLRALNGLPPLLEVLSPLTDSRAQEAVQHLRAWDGHLEPDRVGAAIFELFFVHWTKAVVREHFEGEAADLLASGANSLAAALLEGDGAGWFAPNRREVVLAEALNAALDWLTNRLGPDMSQWTWGRIHTLPLRHYLSGRGDLAQLLDHGGQPVKGDSWTVCNTGLGAQYEARSGGGYRMIAELAATPPALWAIDGQGQSGHPGSQHYADQLTDWLAGKYHRIPLDAAEAANEAVHKLTLEPRGK